ncbi:long-chain fatty acid--CoA ligase [Peribacillus sp. TH24]|uniref:long-chain-fatty-acid--CoA ligase n=1 Tax=Peribacillus sp. TH24 TaxID=2798483 RepID=UPI0019147732|nr:long-chain fatty acid--CoA ligase [Peribacillus sp. TH24]MBK5441552.1 long-chain fatty acid--CoA ligase [Peribacillus sp. TH24]
MRENEEISNITLYEMLEQSVSKWSKNEAISYKGEIWTYTQLKNQVDSFAAGLQKAGIKKGERIALILSNCPQYVVAYFGILAIGGVVVQINPMFTKREIQYIISDCAAETIIASDSLTPIIKSIQAETTIKNIISVSIKPSASSDLVKHSYESIIKAGSSLFEPVMLNPKEDLAVIQYTGGTTGRSKGVMLTHRNLVANIEQHNMILKETMIPGVEKVLTVIPLFHVYGMTICMNLGILQGSCLILLPKFHLEEVLNTIKWEKPTRFAGVPTMYTALNNHPEAEKFGLNSIKLCHSGSSPLPGEVMDEFERRTGAEISESYGLSEAAPGVLCTPSYIKRKNGSVGIPLPYTEAKILDLATGLYEADIGVVGELVIRGPQIMKGYWNMPKETEASLKDGWLYTGDIAKKDGDGFYYIVDRKKDLIIASGYNVYPREVEEVLYEHPSILEAVVVGIKDDYRGETVKAVIVLKEGKYLTKDELTIHCQKYLSPYKVPKVVDIRETLPKTSVGKILRRTLKE